MLGNPDSSCELQVAVAQTLGSVAKGMETHLKALIDCGAITVLLNCLLRSTNKKMTEACLCCLKTIFIHPEVSTKTLKLQSYGKCELKLWCKQNSDNFQF